MENAFGQPQNVIVLGGSSDIARAITKKLCTARAHTVVLAGRNQQLLDESAKEAQEYGATKTETLLFQAEDVSKAGEVVTAAFDKVGENVDLVIIAVGMLGDQRELENDPLGSARMADVNYTWPVAALGEIRRRLVAQGSGRILVISSVASVRVCTAMRIFTLAPKPDLTVCARVLLNRLRALEFRCNYFARALFVRR